jgi:glyoxylase-like metal-dependent hydrolase (beta-lactamase superfamily II)
MPEYAAVSSCHVGDIKVHFLADGGSVTQATVAFPASTPDVWGLHPEYLDEGGNLVSSIGGFLIETGDRKVVIDTGIGPTRLDIPGMGYFEGGNFLNSLAAIGVGRSEVTDVIYTHLHFDHVGWTTQPSGVDRELTFPHARHLTTDAEWGFWHGGADPFGPDAETVQRPLEDRLEMMKGGMTIAPGVDVLSTPGHTPGHVSLVVSEGSERGIILGDILHCPLQLTEAEWNIAADVDPELARRTREEMYLELEKPGTFAANNHFAEAVFGRIILTEGKRTWHMC